MQTKLFDRIGECNGTIRSGSRVFGFFAATCMGAALLGGCAGPSRPGPIRGGETVSIVVPEKSQPNSVINIHNTELGADSSVGAGSGAVVGGLWGLACGPFAPLCIPVAAVIGAASGGVIGVAAGATGALSADKAAMLRERLNNAQTSHDIRQELRESLAERANKRWDLTRSPSEVVLTVELQDLQVTSTRDERIGLIIRVVVSVRHRDLKEHAPATTKVYEYLSPVSDLAVWVDDSSDFLDTSLTSASKQLSAQIVSELAMN